MGFRRSRTSRSGGGKVRRMCNRCRMVYMRREWDKFEHHFKRSRRYDHTDSDSRAHKHEHKPQSNLRCRWHGRFPHARRSRGFWRCWRRRWLGSSCLLSELPSFEHRPRGVGNLYRDTVSPSSTRWRSGHIGKQYRSHNCALKRAGSGRSCFRNLHGHGSLQFRRNDRNTYGPLGRQRRVDFTKRDRRT